MKILIAYGTKYGATEKASKRLADYLDASTDLVNLSKDTVENICAYDVILLGASIYAGKIQKEVEDFCNKNTETLMKKKLGLFLCCGFEEKAEEQLALNFEQDLISHAAALGFFGYEFHFEKMNFFFKMIVKKAAKVQKSTFELKEDKIREFSEKVKNLSA